MASSVITSLKSSIVPPCPLHHPQFSLNKFKTSFRTFCIMEKFQTPTSSKICVPLPTTGPFVPPNWVRETVEKQPWRGGLEPCGELSYTVDSSCVEGSIPRDLVGRFYVCGPGRIRVGDSKYGHWFDGDGMVSYVELNGSGGGVAFKSKWVKTKLFLEQEKAGNKKLVGSRVWSLNEFRFQFPFIQIPGNPSNTSVLNFGGKLYSLCEGGPPTEINPYTLDTIGPIDTKTNSFFSAHPKVDPATGILYNQGFSQMSFNELVVFSVDQNMNLINKNKILLKNISFVHDLIISQNFIVIVISPYYIKNTIQTLWSIFGISPLGFLFRYYEDEGTRVIILSKKDLSIVHDSIIPDSFSTYHFCNAFEKDGNLHVLINVLNGPRSALENLFKDMYNANFHYSVLNTVTEFIWEIDSWKLKSKLVAGETPGGTFSPLGAEFPFINPQYIGRQNRFVYTPALRISTDKNGEKQKAPGASEHNVHSDHTISQKDYGVPQDQGYLNVIQKYDLEKGLCYTHLLPYGHFVSGDPCFVGKKNSCEEDAGYLVVCVYDSIRHATNMVILDAEEVEKSPLAVIRMKNHIPYYFHGTWVEKRL